MNEPNKLAAMFEIRLTTIHYANKVVTNIEL